MKITKETDYAFRIVMFLSMHQNDEKRFNGDELVEINEIPKNLGKRILTRLVDGKIIKSKKGIGGGFSLNRDRKDITLLDVMNVIEVMDFKDCVANSKNCTFKEGKCAIHKAMVKIKKVLFAEFEAVNFDDLVKSEEKICKSAKRKVKNQETEE